MTKKIYFEPAGRIHSAQWELINHPPEGYKFITAEAFKRRTVDSDFLFFTSRRLWEWLLPLNLTKARIDGFTKRIPEDIDLVYAYNHPVFRKKPWVAFVEWAHVLIGRDTRHFKRYKGLVERILASTRCRRILVWSESAMRSILSNLNYANIENKVEIVPQAVPSKKFVKDYGRDKVKLLFVSSANVPQAFDAKGGKEVLEAFSILKERYQNVELVIRARIPSNLKAKYGKILYSSNIRLIEDTLPWKLLEKEFVEADIFLYPTHELYNTVILDAMSYGLPLVTTEIGSTRRIENEATGLLVKNHKVIPVNWEEMIPTPVGLSPYRAELINSVDSGQVEEIVEKTSALIENPSLRETIGKTAQQKTVIGEFSIEKRNKKLKAIFDKATHNSDY